MMILEDELLGSPFGVLPIFRGELCSWLEHLPFESMYFLLERVDFPASHVSLLEERYTGGDCEENWLWGR